jgi:pimeloyl-ACP methyl ester carboxylesterase
MNPGLPVCEYRIEGNTDGPTLVFIHGWPDNASLWRRQVEVLSGKFRCVLVTLPNFGIEFVKAGGFDFPELTDMLTTTIKQVQPDGKVGLFGERKPLMFHSPEWLQIVSKSGGRAQGVAGAGHWLMETHAEAVNEQLVAWFGDLLP